MSGKTCVLMNDNHRSRPPDHDGVPFAMFSIPRYHNSKPIKESKDYKFIFEGDRCSLIIPCATKNHQGSYRCKALNSAGETSSNCKIKVTGGCQNPSCLRSESIDIGIECSILYIRFRCEHGGRDCNLRVFSTDQPDADRYSRETRGASQAYYRSGES